MNTWRTYSSTETRRLGRKAAAALKKRGGVIALSGNLGAGKTTFAQGFLAAFGIGRSPSPTFVLMKRYRRRGKNIYHIDCYRLKGVRAARKAGLSEALGDAKGIALVEWAGRIKGLLPRGAVKVFFRHGAAPHERLIRIKGLSSLA